MVSYDSMLYGTKNVLPYLIELATHLRVHRSQKKYYCIFYANNNLPHLYLLELSSPQ